MQNRKNFEAGSRPSLICAGARARRTTIGITKLAKTAIAPDYHHTRHSMLGSMKSRQLHRFPAMPALLNGRDRQSTKVMVACAIVENE